MTSDLSEDLIVDIFSRLQTKPLLRFRSVSKSLYALITSPTFIRLHTLRSPKKFMITHLNTRRTCFEGKACGTRFYTLHSEDQLSQNPYIGVTPIEYPFKHFRIVGSCNGIICVYEFGNGFKLWNPSISRIVRVHDHPSWSPCSHVIGIGFDPVIQDYKILTISRQRSFVYTMKTQTWREIASPTTWYSVLDLYQCLFSGALHWRVKGYILKFDLSSEVFSTIELPEPSWETSQVTIIKGSLAVISSKHDNSRIWVRREYPNTAASWSVLFELNTNPFKEVKRVFQRATNGDFLLHHFAEGIQVYSPDIRIHLWTISKLSHSLVIDMIMCVESLELLDMGSSCK